VTIHRSEVVRKPRTEVTVTIYLFVSDCRLVRAPMAHIDLTAPTTESPEIYVRKQHEVRVRRVCLLQHVQREYCTT